MWVNIYNESKINKPILDKYLDIINYNELNDYREKRGRDEVSFTDDLFDAPAYVKVTVDGKNYYFDNDNEKFIMEDGYILDTYENLLPSTDENKGDFYLDNINTFYN